MKVQEWLDKNPLYVTLGVLDYVKSLVPVDAELVDAVSDVRPTPQGMKPQGFAFLLPDRLITGIVTDKPLEGTTSRVVSIKTRVQRLCDIASVERSADFEVARGETWPGPGEDFTVVFDHNSGAPVLRLPPEGEIPVPISQQYRHLGRTLCDLASK